jgi:hypothetical protein
MVQNSPDGTLPTWSLPKRVAIAVGAPIAWLVGMAFGVAWLQHGIVGYRCPGIGPGESCSFTSVRGTVRVPYEELGQVSVFSLLLGAATVIVVTTWLWQVERSVWRHRPSALRRSLSEIPPQVP